MRELKVRAWNGSIFRYYPIGMSIYHMDRFEISEYIGIQDKNNVDIYEGDIVKAIRKSHDKNIPEEWTGRVRYGMNNCCWGLSRKVDRSMAEDGSSMQNHNIPIFNFINFNCGIVPDMDFEIVGNIYKDDDGAFV